MKYVSWGFRSREKAVRNADFTLSFLVEESLESGSSSGATEATAPAAALNTRHTRHPAEELRHQLTVFSPGK